MTTVLVLGGTAWLGREVARQAAAAGHEVTCLARGESGRVPDGVRWVRADRDAPGTYAGVDRDWDVVVDVARQPGHVRGAVEALGGRVGHWVFVSTGNVYADLSVPLHEDQPLRAALASDAASPEEYGEGKVACEEAVRGLSRHLVMRVGLVAGPGDPSDRAGYWVSRFALAQDQAVLAPALPDATAQVIDVRDVAAFALEAAAAGVTGVLDVAGVVHSFEDHLGLSAAVAGHTGPVVTVDPRWAADHDVAPWSGGRSFPLWLPDGFAGMCRMRTERAEAAGLRRRSLAETLRDVLADERSRGLDRPRAAGLSRPDELDLLTRLSRS